jgi:hypothetical protein
MTAILAKNGISCHFLAKKHEILKIDRKIRKALS